MRRLRKVTQLLGLVTALLLMSQASPGHYLCEGFIPENDQYIPVNSFRSNGMDEAEFDRILDAVESVYTPIISDRGGNLNIVRNWNDATVNASARRLGREYRVNMYGGLARHPSITSDGFMLVACHEVGHHLGGAPKIKRWFGGWATNEGQADYFANLQCLRKVFEEQDNLDFVNKGEFDMHLVNECENQFTSDADQALCIRASMAGMSVARLFQNLRKQTRTPSFSTPDTNTVTRTDDAHPGTQCRLDTYFQGSLCAQDPDVELSDNDIHQGNCTLQQGFRTGLRPRCWFAPN